MKTPAQRTARFGAGRAVTRALVYGSLVVYLVVVVFPMAWVVMTSLKQSRELFTSSNPWALPTSIHWANFAKAWTDGHFGAYFANSLKVTGGAVALILIAGTMVSYVIGHLRPLFGKPLSNYFLAGMALPAQLAMIPLFFLLLRLGMLNSHFGLILVYTANSMPFTVFVLSAFFSQLPSALHDAAEIDGCSEWQIFTRVMLPIARSGIITVAIFNFLGVWNEYLYALVFLSDGKLYTLPLGLANLAIAKQYDTDFGALFAGMVIVMVPTLLVYILLQKHLIKGLSAGAVKG